MFSFDSWIIPFTFISGVGMLVLSTSNRLCFVSTLIREIAHTKDHIFSSDIEKLVKRAHHFHVALVSFYISIVLLALAALIGSMSHYLNATSSSVYLHVTNTVTIAGILSIIVGAFHLVIESIIASHLILSCEKTNQLLKKTDHSLTDR